MSPALMLLFIPSIASGVILSFLIAGNKYKPSELVYLIIKCNYSNPCKSDGITIFLNIKTYYY
jgi:hypothetical protein